MAVPLTRRPATEAEAIAWLVDHVPELRPLLDEHIADNEELLPYVVFEGDFLRWSVDCVRAGDHEPAQRFVTAIELLMTTDVDPPANDRVRNLAGVAFVEGLVMQSGADDAVTAIEPWMGTNTRRDFERTLCYRSGELPPTA
jgi:hypothetical protein